MFKRINLNKPVRNWLAYSLLAVIVMHLLSMHSIAESLVYCFEGNGEVNIEYTGNSKIGFKSEQLIHEEEHASHNEPVFHQHSGHHKDVPLSTLCSLEDLLNRSDQKQMVQNLGQAVSQNIELAFPSRLIHYPALSFLPLLAENLTVTKLRTVILLN